MPETKRGQTPVERGTGLRPVPLRGSDPIGVLDVAIAVIEQDGRYLISQRLPKDSFGGFWEFPGGKSNPGETLEACLAREIQEELGVEITVGTKLQVVEYQYPRRKIHLHCFSCRIVTGEPRAIECSTWRWVLPKELLNYAFPPASKQIIEGLQP